MKIISILNAKHVTLNEFLVFILSNFDFAYI